MNEPATGATSLQTQLKAEMRVLLLATAALIACSSKSQPAAEGTPRSRWLLVVDNHHWLDVTVYIIRDGLRTRVGSVTTARPQSFLLSPRLLGQGRAIRLEARAIGSSARTSTETIIVHDGARVEWTLETGLDRSSVAVWAP